MTKKLNKELSAHVKEKKNESKSLFPKYPYNITYFPPIFHIFIV